ncbi:protein BASIC PENTACYSTEINE7-like [Ananas comosus]|uniref:GAGA-binding transcriptional activator n=4 Tax=Ananas comosus TaxID=4615 RepID=A0A6P5ETA3_ANACO|nr:protein BASIC PENTACYSTEINE7-like [Ananas comosus]XP_020084423.1 protein BASIC PENTACYSTEINE7-like [Ananas comosus]XP_020084424.1 protein BASIC PENTACYSTEINE7-like [Ananas comosus]XP_020084425.1 protein BASIC PENTACYSTEINE7-like [Ananas comosus]CAD1845083.1 unnamed protein product [Ananas comosus var. bracteatus]
MDGSGRLGPRNWEFSDRDRRGESMLKPRPGVPAHNNVIHGHHETSLKMSSYSGRDSLIAEHNSELPSMDFSWVPQKNFFPASKAIIQEVPPRSSPMIDIHSAQVDEGEPQNLDGKQQSSTKKANRTAAKALRPKEPKKRSSKSAKKKESCVANGKVERKSLEHDLGGVMLDLSSVPVPVCSCTGVARRCYRWGTGGWQSSCCTKTISEYPLPMSPSRPGSRLAGRKMSVGAYEKLLQRLAAEGHDLSYAVDLKDHWARHGTNKFVTIK